MGIIRKIKASFKRKQTLDRKRKDPLLNPKGPKGEILRCKACDSFRHMINECPHSWENLEQNKSLVVNESDECLLVRISHFFYQYLERKEHVRSSSVGSVACLTV